MIYEYKNEFNNSHAIVQIGNLRLGAPVEVLWWIRKEPNSPKMWWATELFRYRKITESELEVIKLEYL